MGSVPTPPGTELAALYDTLGLMREQERVALARCFAASPGILAGMFKHSAARFSRYCNPSGEPFNAQKGAPAPSSRRARTPQATGILDGRDLAVFLAAGESWRVAGAPELDFDVLDFEIRPGRTTGHPDSTSAGTRGLSIDLLLRAADGLPIVCEVKVGADRDAFYALVQALAAAAQLVSPPQQARLAQNYPSLEGDGGRLDVWLLIAPRTSPAKYHAELRTAAEHIAETLMAEGAIGQWVRRIAFVEASRTDDGLVLGPAVRWETSMPRKGRTR